jgi:RimJ/RimL family protein N-acetyltransferase
MVVGAGGGGTSEGRVSLRDAAEGDLSVFFEHQLDADAIHMAAFTAEDPSDRASFAAHWNRILANETIVKKTVLLDDRVAGYVSSFEQSGEREVTYWLGREYWGRGVATAALREFLRLDATRPLYARAAKDNLGSIRVLQKCGFEISGEDRGFANARGEEVEEFVLTLGAEPGPIDVPRTGHP